MNRRNFLQRAGLIAAGVVAADQLDLLDRLGWKRRFFPGASFGSHPLTQEPIIQVVDQYGQVLGESRAVNGVAEFRNLHVGSGHDIVTLTFSAPGRTVTTENRYIPITFRR